MGYPGKNYTRYQTPKRPFEKSRIEEETRLVVEYGLRNKREVWKATGHLRRYRRAARDLLAMISAGTEEAKVATKRAELIDHMQRMGLLGPGADVEDVLSLRVQQELERRLQTVVYRKGLARSPKQARQFITHGHIAIGGRRVTIPGYRVTRNEEGEITYYGRSPLSDGAHAERVRVTRSGGAPR